MARIVTFLILTFGLSTIFWFRIITAGSLSLDDGLDVLALMWCPGVAGLVTSLVWGRSLRRMGWGLPRPSYLGIAYILPILVCLLVYPFVWVMGLGGFTSENSLNLSLPLFLLVAGTVGMVNSLISAAGEEIGWRGLLVPQLAQLMSPTRTALISGAIWLLWHLPIILFANYNAGTDWWYGLGCFSIMLMSASFLATWLRLKSGSLWPAVVLHASHNLFVQAVFDALTVSAGVTAYLTGEFGIGLAIASALVALVVWHVWPVNASSTTRRQVPPSVQRQPGQAPS
jgi:membrane protease YdiL (CAAX protease family)